MKLKPVEKTSELRHILLPVLADVASGLPRRGGRVKRRHPPTYEFHGRLVLEQYCSKTRRSGNSKQNPQCEPEEQIFIEYTEEVNANIDWEHKDQTDQAQDGSQQFNFEHLDIGCECNVIQGDGRCECQTDDTNPKRSSRRSSRRSENDSEGCSKTN